MSAKLNTFVEKRIKYFQQRIMKFMDFLATNKREFLLLNAIALLVYTFFCLLHNFPLSENLMFSSTDSKGYFEVSQWILWGEETNYLSKRPLLYPFLIGVPQLLFGAAGVWLFQVGCWFLLINSVFFGVRKWTQNTIAAWISAGILLLNFTLVAMTLHALTEVVTATLLGCLFYFVARHRQERKSLYFIQGVVLYLMALTLVKPLFYYPLLIILLLAPICYFRLYKRNVFAILKLGLIIVPLILQMSLVWSTSGKFKVSTIGEETFISYYFAQTVRQIEGLDEAESIAFSKKLSNVERKRYMKNHDSDFTHRFFENIDLNIKAEPVFLEPKKKSDSNLLYDFMTHYNRGTFLIHLIGLLLMIVCLFVFWRQKDFENLVVLILVGGLSTNFICTSGISFWQGDRLVVPAIALWAALYPGLFFSLVKHFKNRKVQKTHAHKKA